GRPKPAGSAPPVRLLHQPQGMSILMKLLVSLVRGDGNPLVAVGRISWFRRFFGVMQPPGSPDDDRPAPGVGRSGGLCLLGWAQVGSLAALVGTLVVLTSEPTPHEEGSPAWAMPTGHPVWVNAVAFAPDGRRLATGGSEGTVVLWAVGRGAERELPGDPA